MATQRRQYIYTRIARQFDLSGGIQNSTSKLLRKSNELDDARNATFGDMIGAVSRRLGYTQLGGAVQVGKDGLGAFVHRYSTGTRAYAATNNSGDTATVLKYLSGSTWTDLGPSIAANTRISSINFLDEAYVVGANGTTYMTPINIDSSPAYSSTRNVQNMPKAKWVAEFQGSLYAINVDVGGTKYPDRAYKSSPAQGIVTFVKTDQTLSQTYTNQVPQMTSNSAPSGTASASSELGAELAYQAFNRNTLDKWTPSSGPTGWLQYQFALGVTAKQYSIVGALSGRETQAPKTWTFQGSNNGSTWTTLDTQTAVSAWSAGEKRTYTFSNLTSYSYYRLDITLNQGDATYLGIIELEIATADAGEPLKVDSVRYLKTGMAIDIYAAGTENKLYDLTITSVDKSQNIIYVSPVTLTVSDNDEIWLDGRKGKLSVLWNTDHPTPESSDYLRIPPGQDESSNITAWAKTNNRLLLFTSNSLTKWDGANFVPVSTTVGCLQHECVQNIGSWVIWPHTTGIWAYNDSTGQLKLISRGIQSWIKAVPLANWDSASAVAIDNTYKLSVGGNLTLNNKAIQGNIRFIYNFDLNVWSIESHTRNQRFQFIWTVSNVRNPYFQDDTGLVLKDESGYMDLTATIPWSIELGANQFGVDEGKSYETVFLYAPSPQGALVQYQIDSLPWQTLGELKKPIQKFRFPLNTEGNTINYRLSLNASGERPIVEGVSTHYSVIEGFYGR